MVTVLHQKLPGAVPRQTSLGRGYRETIIHPEARVVTVTLVCCATCWPRLKYENQPRLCGTQRFRFFFSVFGVYGYELYDKKECTKEITLREYNNYDQGSSKSERVTEQILTPVHGVTTSTDELINTRMRAHSLYGAQQSLVTRS